MTIFEAYNSTKKKLEAAGIEDYVFEAKEIIKHITGLDAAHILTNYTKELSLFQSNNLTAIVRQREIRYPLQYIFTKWDFYGRSYYVGPGVLVPRADTETIIDVCLEYLKDKADIELNEAFNAIAKKGDIFEKSGADGEYDLIVSNPPYIPENEMEIISPETKFEPVTALLALDGGMEFYKAIINNYTDSLKSGGMLCFEVGVGESERVCELLTKAGYKNISVKKDLNGIERSVSAIK